MSTREVLLSWVLCVLMGYMIGSLAGCCLPKHKSSVEGPVAIEEVVQQEIEKPPPLPPEPSMKCEEGGASWYGPYDSYSGTAFHGRKTANGERYDMYKYTAAHKTLPFNTMVKVYKLDKHGQETGEYVEVRINDRGPFIKGRIIDLSKVAAQDIDMIRSGTAPVKICWDVSPNTPQ